MSVDESYNFRRITHEITTSGVVGVERLEHLGDEGYQAVINLLPDDSEYAVADEASIVREQGLDYIYIPVDYDDPTQSDLEAFTAAMDAHENNKVHVHCAANYRVTAFYALHALSKGIWTADQADALISDVWNLADFPKWQQFNADQRARFAGEAPPSS